MEYNYTLEYLARRAELGAHLEYKARIEISLLNFYAHLDSQNQEKLANAIIALAQERGYI